MKEIDFMIRLWAMLTHQKLVMLLDHDGETTLAIERFGLDGTRFAYRHRFPGRFVFLNSNGSTTGLGHVKKWNSF